MRAIVTATATVKLAVIVTVLEISGCPVARDNYKTSLGQPFFRKNKGLVAREEFVVQHRKKFKYLHYCVA